LILDIRQPYIIPPAVGVHGGEVAAAVVGAIDQDTAHTGRAHFAEGDLGLAGEFRHAPIIAPLGPGVKPLDVGALAAGRTMARLLDGGGSVV